MKSRYLHLFGCFLLLFSGQLAPAQVHRHAGAVPYASEWLDQNYQSWTYLDDYDTSSGENSAGNPNNDIQYYFHIAQPAIVVIHHAGSSLDHTSLLLTGHELSGRYINPVSTGNSSITETERILIEAITGSMATALSGDLRIIRENQALLCLRLEAGDYNLVCEGADTGTPNNGVIRTSVYAYHLGTSFNEALDLGVFHSDYRRKIFYMANTFTSGSEHSFFCRVRFDTRTEISVDGSSYRGSRGTLSLLDEQGTMIDQSTNYPAIENIYPQLPKITVRPGTYYIRSDFNGGLGMLAVNINSCPALRHGDSMDDPFVPNSFFGDQTYTTSELDTREFTDRYLPHEGKDAFISMNLLYPNRVTLSDANSLVQGGIVATWLDYEGNEIEVLDTSRNPDAEVSFPVSPGSYYLVLEGAAEDGPISVKVVMRKIDSPLGPDPFVPDKKVNHIVTMIPTEVIPGGSYVYESERMRCAVDYYDGLGRPLQTVRHAASPTGSDLVAAYQEYDVYGRPSNNWLPLPGGTGGKPLSADSILSSAKDFYNDRAPFSTTGYENNPLNRVNVQYGPGQTWRTAGKAIRTTYTTETIRKFEVAGTREEPQLVASGDYAPGELQVTEVADEDGHRTKTYKDYDDRTVCVDAGNHKTRYVYDSYGNLCFVLPPMIADTIPGAAQMNDYAYMYKYDTRNRCIAKKLPGADWTRYWFDAKDYPVFSQDGEQRVRNEWSLSIPDEFGREVIRAVSRKEPDKSLSSSYIRVHYDENYPFGYRIPPFGEEIPPEDILQINYYDSYLFLWLPGCPAGDLKYEPDAAYGRRYGRDLDPVKHKGLLTGSVYRILGAADSLQWSAAYYDYRKRVIQTRQTQLHGGLLIRKNKYNFAGEVVETNESVRPAPDAAPDVLLTDNEYDRMGRVLHTKTRLNNDAPAVLNYRYDAIGRLEAVTHGDSADSIRTERNYNVRSWLTRMKNKEFDMSLSYDYSMSHATPSNYSGNITEWRWSNGPTSCTYGFRYDDLSRLRETRQYDYSLRNDQFVESGITYDANSNLLTLNRTESGLPKHGFRYSYRGNQLIGLTDSVSGQTWQYAYDRNGNMTLDGANSLEIGYNRLNLIENVRQEGTTLAKYAYLSDGTKLSATNAVGNGLFYTGSLVYRMQENSMSLESAGFAGGRFVAKKTAGGKSFTPHYFLTDHLGSVRVVVDGSTGEVLERSNYYPFGLRWNESGSQISDNRFRYNGKEEQAFLDVPYIDYGARMYDPKMRLNWNGPDPLATDIPSVSPYVFCGNNPIVFVDPDGKAYHYNRTTEQYEDEEGNYVPWAEVEAWIRYEAKLVYSSMNKTYGPRLSAMAESSNALVSITGLMGEFLTGFGEKKHEFEKDHPLTVSMMNSNMTKIALKQFYKDYRSNNIQPSYPITFLPFGFGDTGPLREYWADGTSAVQFVGSATYFFEISDGNVEVRILDSKTPNSLFYHLVPARYSRDTFPIMGETFQIYKFSIPLSDIPNIIQK